MNCRLFMAMKANIPVIFKMYKGDNTHLTADSFASHDTDSIAEIDTTATAVTAGANSIAAMPLATDNSKFVQVATQREFETFELVLEADGTTQPIFFVTATMGGTGAADVMVTLNWEEVLL